MWQWLDLKLKQKNTHNKALHRTAIPLRSIAAAELRDRADRSLLLARPTAVRPIRLRDDTH
jgi:hypothetical protein